MFFTVLLYSAIYYTGAFYTQLPTRPKNGPQTRPERESVPNGANLGPNLHQNPKFATSWSFPVDPVRTLQVLCPL